MLRGIYMRKQTQFVLVGIMLVMLTTISLTGCMDEKSKFVGTWQNQDGSTTMIFDSNNRVTITGTGPLGIVSLTGIFNYSVANQKITFSSGSIGETLNYSFSQSNQLIISNDLGTSVIFNKQ
jgi:hypothetical protein